jgi:hypothetical protein
MVQAVQRQTQRYVEAYGPGMVLWTKHGFCEGMKAALGEDVLNAVPHDVHRKTVALQQKVTSRGVSRLNNFFTPRAISAQSMLDRLLYTGFGDFVDPPRSPALSLKFQWSVGQRLGGESVEDPRQARLAYLEKVQESERAAKLVALMAELEKDEDSLTTLLQAMFAPEETDSSDPVEDPDAVRKKAVADAEFLCRMLCLTGQGKAALNILGKVLRNILANPGEEK